jgi:hypothetical protein
MLTIEKPGISNELPVGTFTLIAAVASSIGTRSLRYATEMMAGNQERLVK